MPLIPEELRQLKQWVCFDILPPLEEGKKPRKIPFTPGTTRPAESDNPSTWRTFEEAIKDVVDGKRQYLGLAIEEPFVFIDLDESHPEIEAVFDTYKQRSVSGEGTHIIGKGHFSGPGIHPSSPAVGMFQSARFCLFTGDVVDGCDTIKDLCPDTLQSVYNWLSGGKEQPTADLIDTEPQHGDEEVLNRCRKRFDTFQSLWEGNAGDDHSASDHALISMLADESCSNEQVRRLFMSSPLCRPHRATTKYIDRSLKKVRGKQRELSAIFEVANDNVDEEPDEEFQDLGDRDKIDSLPDGLIKRIADWHWKQSLYPLQECSIAVAFATISTVAGRNYQTMTRSGLNPWIILLAETSWGKNEYASGINSIFGKIDHVSQFSATNFSKMVGSSAASGEGLEDQLLRTARLNSYFPEFDMIFKNLTSPNPAAHIQSLTRFVLDLYGRSGQDSYLKKRFKARGKDEAETPPVQAPCLTISGETIAEKLYRHMTLENIESGFLQRFSLFEAERESVSVLANPNQGTPMPEDLVEELFEFFGHCEMLANENTFVTVDALDNNVKEFLYNYVNKKRKESLTTRSEGIKQVLNRAGFKVFKVSALFAVADNWRNPKVKQEHVEWAIAFVDDCDENLLTRFTAGATGTGQMRQESEVLELLRSVLAMGTKKRINIGIPKEIASCKVLVPQNWLKSRIASSPSFSGDRRGAVVAFNQTIKSLEADGKITVTTAAESNYTKIGGNMVGMGL